MRRKKSSSHIVTIVFVCLFLIATIVGALLFFRYKQSSKQIAAMQTEMDQNQQTVYVATRDIAAGETLAVDGDNPNVEMQNIYTGLDASTYITDSDLGRVAAVNIPYGVTILSAMTTDANIEKDTRNYEVSVASLMTTQKDNDFVDVRIAFATGEDYLLLAKKQVNDLDLKNSIFHTQMNEEEILRFESAIIDAYKHKGTRIYVTKYVQPSLQETAEPTYPVNERVYDLITNNQLDPNVITSAKHTLSLQARLDLEHRLGKLTEEEIEAVEGKVSEQEALLSEVHGNKAEAEEEAAENE